MSSESPSGQIPEQIPVLPLTREAIRSLAGESFFARGEDYFRRGAVKSLAISGNGITATVAGAKDYQATLGFQDKTEWQCSCPVGQRRLFCKHLAAVALAWLNQKTEDGEQKTDGVELVSCDEEESASIGLSARQELAEEVSVLRPPSSDFCDVPPLPLRYLRDYLYCPRLFYLQWVENLFGSNPFVEPLEASPEAFPEIGVLVPGKTVRRIHLENPELGLSGVVWVIDGADGLQCFHQCKNGPPADGAAIARHPLQPEKTRLAASFLLLRAAGYVVAPLARLFFADGATAVTVPLDNALLADAGAAVRAARALAASGRLPPPLTDDLRCLACPAYSLCLPRESIWWRGRRVHRQRDNKTRFLPGMEAAMAPLREIAAPDLSAQPPRPPVMAGEILVVQTPGAVIGRRQGEFVVTIGGETVSRLPLRETRAIHIYGPAQLTTQATQTALQLEVDVAYFSRTGHFLGLLRGLPASGVDARLGQYRLFTHPFIRLRLAGEIIRAKIHNQRVLLMRNGSPAKADTDELARLRDAAVSAQTLAELRGIEGAAARLYFHCFPSMFKNAAAWAFDFAGRNRRPPKDPVNAILSFGYSLLAKELTGVCHTVGLDPFLGFLHEPRYGRPALALDLMEEFRPLVADSVAVSLINRGEVDGDDFSRTETGVWLNDKGRRAFWEAWFRRLDTQVSHPEFKYKMSYRRMFEAQARQLWRFARGDAVGYSGFTTR